MRISAGSRGLSRNGGNIHVPPEIPFITIRPTIKRPINQSVPPAPLEIKDAVFREFIRLSPASNYIKELVIGFAAVALLLGVVVLYSVIAYSVSQRTREIGVRIALGSQRGMVYRLIMKEAGVLALAGIVIGTGCAIVAATLMRKLLFGTPPWDITTLVCMAIVLGTSALLASFLPARRAASVDPISALRAE